MFAPDVSFKRTAWTLLASISFCALAAAQINLIGPQPGDVYREFYRAMPPSSTEAWRVTDPNVSLNLYPQAAPFLPNPSIDIGISDLTGAVRAEAVISMWGGHVGTAGKKIRFNGNSWITIPELGSQNGIPAGHNGECYISGPTVVVSVPLSHLHTGTNYFEGTNTGQTCYSFQWGQHGWYNLILRVYYDPSQVSHPSGYISSVANGGTLSDNPTITTAVSAGNVDRIDVLASYYNFSTDGDGIYNGYHWDYFPTSTSDASLTLRGHVGTATGSSRSVTWYTDWVPDQAAGGIKLLAHLRDASGVWYCTSEVTNVSLGRSGYSVKLYTPYDVPERAWARGDLSPVVIHVNIPASDNIADATAAVYHIRTWNGIDGDDETGIPPYRRLNSWTDGNYGANHFYSYDLRTVPTSALLQGTNTFSFYASTTAAHGIEIQWPGPALAVRYSGTPSNNPPTITAHPTNQTVAEGQTATFTVSATGSGTLSYQWQKNDSDIGGATNPSYTTPVLTPADSGSHYRCVVSNAYGSATTNEALLSVISVVAPQITAEPLPLTVQDGQQASFSVTATGTGPLSYQWQKNAANVTGANASTYSFTAAYADSGALFRCIVSNTKGADTSSAAMLSVTAVAPTIATQPASQQVSVGDTVTFTVVATGSLPRYYAWEKSDTPIPGATAASYTFVAEKTDSGVAFRCKVTNSAGSVISNPAYLIVGTFPPTITAHPVQAFVQLGQTATFNVTATGTRPLAYQWQRDSVDIPGATSPSYTTPPVVLDDNGRYYRCVVTNNYGTATSESAVLSVTSDVLNLIANGGFELGTPPWVFYTNGSGSFSNDSTGPASLHAAYLAIATAGNNMQLYQQPISLTADTPYTLLFKGYSSSGHDFEVSIFKTISPYTNYGLAQHVFDLGTTWGNYRADFTATGFSGTVSDARMMFWLVPYGTAGDRYFVDDVVLVKTSTLIAPAITRQPAGKSVKEGEMATFSVAVTGTTPITYQWEKNQVTIPGATAAAYTTPPVTLADDNAEFRCVVTNVVGSVTSEAAVLTVTPATAVGPPEAKPAQFYLAQNHPNPFNPSTTIEFGVPTAAHVTLKVVNLLGQEVKTLVDDYMAAGMHQVTFHADGLPSGVYLYRMEAGSFVATKKLVLIR
jgi:hypothetical protein